MSITLAANCETKRTQQIAINLDVVALAELIAGWVSDARQPEEVRPFVAALVEIAGAKRSIASRLEAVAAASTPGAEREQILQLSREIDELARRSRRLAFMPRDLDPNWVAENIELGMLSHQYTNDKRGLLLRMSSASFKIDRENAAELALQLRQQADRIIGLAQEIAESLPNSDG